MKKVLIVDDTKNIRMLLTTCLELNGYSVTCKSEGKDAIEMLKCESFDLIFLDIKMPEVSGTEVLRRIREMGVKTPVIIMTAFATVKNAVECTRLGAVAYLQKPFTQDKIKNVISELNINCEESDVIGKIKNCIKYGEIENGIKLCKTLISEEPENGQVYHFLGRLYENKGEKDRAEKFYLTAKIFGFKE